MDPYAISMMPRTFVATHISLLHASIVEHIQDPFFMFYNVVNRARWLLWSLPTVPPWVELKTRHHDFMFFGVPGWQRPRFQAYGPCVTISTELLRREEFEQRSITTHIVCYIFPLLYVPPPPVPTQAPPPCAPPIPSTPQSPANPGSSITSIGCCY